MRAKLLLVILSIFSLIASTSPILADPDDREDREPKVPLPSPTPTPPPSSVAPVVIPDDPRFQQLQASLQSEIDASPYDIAIAVTDLQTGKTIQVKGKEPRLLGCTINFFVLLTVVRELERGVYKVDEVDWSVTETAKHSNATTSRWLLFKIGDGDLYLGIHKVNQLLADIGLKAGPTPAVLNHPPGFWWETDGDFVQNSLTAEQANYALAKFYRGEIVSPAWRDYLLSKMRGVAPGLNYLIPAGTDQGQAVTAHKNGFYPDPEHGWVDNDIGIVTFERNGKTYAYVISIYMQEIPTLYENVGTGQKLSRAVWEFFSDKYTS